MWIHRHLSFNCVDVVAVVLNSVNMSLLQHTSLKGSLPKSFRHKLFDQIHREKREILENRTCQILSGKGNLCV